MEPLGAQNFDRLAKAMMQRHRVGYNRAREMLTELNLRLACGEEIRESAALQAAFLTAINTGKRAFRGGVTVSLPAEVKLRLPWPGEASLNEVARVIGAHDSNEVDDENTSRLLFGTIRRETEGIQVFCDGWRAGLVPVGQTVHFQDGHDFALGGVFAGAFAVAKMFLSAAEISHRDVVEPNGLSLWRPDLSWLDPDAAGRALQHLPAKLWLLGLGHLGQAYAWTLGLLPFSAGSSATIYLQDYDVVEKANWSAGLFCEPNHVGRLKTRVSGEWLEQRGFQTRLIERPFDANTKRERNEPRVALCGFDNAESRQIIEDSNFELIVDAGLGASLDHFDRIVLRTFPDASQKARDIWASPPREISALDLSLFEKPEDECGIILEELAGKAISSSFAGACASSLVVGELLRAIHGGRRCEFMALQLRELDLPRNPYRDEHYQLRVARNGTVPVDSEYAR
jgi:hypothetical protein